MSGPPGGAIEDPRAPTTYVGDVDGGAPRRRYRRLESTHHLCWRRRWQAPWEALSETRECPPPISEMSMAGPIGGADEDTGAPITYVRDVDGGPLGGADGDPGVPTTYVGGVDGSPLGKSGLHPWSKVVL
jgi:hypothetical protein